MRTVPIGRLRTLVSLEQIEAGARDAHNRPVKTWVPYGTRYASIAPLSGSEAIQAASIESTLTHKITMRFIADEPVTSEHRIVLGDRVFEIVSATNRFERGRYVDIMAKEVTS